LSTALVSKKPTGLVFPRNAQGKPLIGLEPRQVYGFGLLIRETEQTLLRLFSAGLLSGTTHTCIGQELCQMAVVRALDDADDVVLSNHRNHGHFLTYSGDFAGLLAEVMGRESGVCGGIGGSQHLAHRRFHSNGVQGGMTAIGAGQGLALKMTGSRGIVAVLIGDGTLGEGLVYESLNLASTWGAPVLFVVENNGIAQTTPTALTTGGDIEARGRAFGLETWRLDDAAPDFLERAEGVVRQARESRRPGFLVIDTQRLGPHSKGDDLRAPAEMEAIQRRDPLRRVGELLAAEEREELEREARATVAAACAAAEAGPFSGVAAVPAAGRAGSLRGRDSANCLRTADWGASGEAPGRGESGRDTVAGRGARADRAESGCAGAVDGGATADRGEAGRDTVVAHGVTADRGEESGRDSVTGRGAPDWGEESGRVSAVDRGATADRGEAGRDTVVARGVTADRGEATDRARVVDGCATADRGEESDRVCVAGRGVTADRGESGRDTVVAHGVTADRGEADRSGTGTSEAGFAGNVRQSLNSSLRALLRERAEVILLGEDLHDPYGGAFKVTAGLSTEFAGRVISTPISEAGIVGAGIGLALAGWRPIVEIMFADFLTLAMDQIFNHAVKFPGMFAEAQVPLVIRTPSGGRRGYGPTHSQSPEGLMCGVPGLTVVFPSARHNPGNLLWNATLRWPHPTVFFEHKLLYGEAVDARDYRAVDPESLFPTLVSGGDDPDVTIVAYGSMVAMAEAMQRRLAEEELEVEVVAPSLLSPLPRETLLEALRGRGRIVVVEECPTGSGFGAELGTLLLESGYRGRFARVASPAVPIPAARSLEEQTLVGEESVMRAILRVLELV
jgi:pyruvate/2-oxoglutarate/acetoin dehydrogenase E1 component/TPP-dependent pyruvate/acetoin dehydrogenase alpha subunit